MKFIGVFILAVSILSFSIGSYADDDVPSSHLWYCPAVHQLQYTQSNKWVKKPYWRSYGTSLSSKLTTFLGAEWQGTGSGGIGQLMCLYSGGNTSNFPVVMHFYSLVYLPHQQDKQQATQNNSSSNMPAKENVFKNWHKAAVTEASGGYLVLNCESRHSPQDCPFYPRVTKPQGDIYKEAENIKGKAGPLD